MTEVILDQDENDFVAAQLASGRFRTEAEVVKEGLKLLREQETYLAEVDAAIAEGLADVEAGRTVDADEVFDRLEEKYRQMAIERGQL